jgi:hypothetical protein
MAITCIEFQNNLTAGEYAALMNDNIEDLTELRLWSLEKIKENKANIARAYNKKVKPKEFCDALKIHLIKSCTRVIRKNGSTSKP